MPMRRRAGAADVPEYSQPRVMRRWKRIPPSMNKDAAWQAASTLRNLGASGSQEDRGVVAQAVLALELGDLPRGMGIVTDIGPRQRGIAPYRAPVTGHARLDRTPGFARIQTNGLLTDDPRPGSALVVIGFAGMRQADNHGDSGGISSGVAITPRRSLPLRESDVAFSTSALALRIQRSRRMRPPSLATRVATRLVANATLVDAAPSVQRP
jgi:hypothetical protein